MLLLFNYTIKPLNQFAKKQTNKKVSVFGATADDFLYHFWQNIFPFFFLLNTSFYEPWLYALYFIKRKKQPVLDLFNKQ